MLINLFAADVRSVCSRSGTVQLKKQWRMKGWIPVRDSGTSLDWKL